MTAIITSIGLSCPKTIDLLKTCNATSQIGQVAAIVPTAAKHGDQKYIRLAEKQLQDLGYKTLLWDWSDDGNRTKLPKKLAIIYVAGGNTPFLMHNARRIDDKLRDYLSSGTIYIGVSAGSIILGESIKPATEILDDDSQSFLSVEGLGYITGDILPHYDGSLHKELANEYEDKVSRRLIRLANNDAMLIDLKLNK